MEHKLNDTETIWLRFCDKLNQHKNPRQEFEKYVFLYNKPKVVYCLSDHQIEKFMSNYEGRKGSWSGQYRVNWNPHQFPPSGEEKCLAIP
jgi:hypothetical protein